MAFAAQGSSGCNFITDQEFNQAVVQQHASGGVAEEDIIFWSDVSTGVIYQIVHFYPYLSKFGKQYVLVLLSYEREYYYVYATNRIKQELKNFTNNNCVTYYIKSLGKKVVSASSRKTTYYDFEVVVVRNTIDTLNNGVDDL